MAFSRENSRTFSIKKDTVYNWLAAKEMPTYKVGRLWKFKISEIDEWVKTGKAGNEKR